MELKSIYTKKAPAPVGPYSQAIIAGGLVFVAGQIALDPKTGALCNGSFEEETRRVLDNLKAVVEAAGATLERSVKVTIYVTDMARFAELNKIYGEYFGESKPARSTVQAAALPKGAQVEIDVIAALP